MTDVSEMHTISILRAEDGNVRNESKAVGNRSAQFRVTTVAQQAFHLTMCVTCKFK
jgi:hypothetical protein